MSCTAWTEYYQGKQTGFISSEVLSKGILFKMYTLEHILPLATVSDKMPLTLLPSTLTLAYFHVLQAACVT